MNKSVKNGRSKKTPSYGRIEISIIGGIFMSREYRHIKQLEKEILELQEKGLTHRDIGERLGFTREQLKESIGCAVCSFFIKLFLYLKCALTETAYRTYEIIRDWLNTCRNISRDVLQVPYLSNKYYFFQILIARSANSCCLFSISTEFHVI